MRSPDQEHPKIPVDIHQLQEHIRFFTTQPRPRHAGNPEILHACADYIEHTFGQYTDRVAIQPFMVRDRAYYNVIGQFGAPEGAHIVVGAHYDVAGNSPGADDNASGVAGLLEIGRLLHHQAAPLKHPVSLVAFPLEEPPFFNTRFMGSAVHAQSLANRGQSVRLMICLEMIGYFSDAPGSQRLPLPLMQFKYPNLGNFIALVGHLGSLRWMPHFRRWFEAGSNIPVEQLSAPRIVPGVALLDHMNYWRQGYQALMITDTAMYRNPHYHLPTDTIDTLNFMGMANVIKGVYWAILHPDSAFP